VELNGSANFLKAGCVFADRINTVSPSYAREIMMPYYGEGLDGILNARAAEVSGIINGIDTVYFNPSDDPRIPAHFTKGRLKGKAVCKQALQERVGLEQRPDVPMFAMVTRMTEQKGFDLVACVLDDLMIREDMQFVLLGTGDDRFENFMRAAEYRYKGRLCSYIGYNEDLAHLIYAGADFFLMPSRFEPCGLSQMIAMRYGTVPIVRETGGLRDTVLSYNEANGNGNGFTFFNYNAHDMLHTIERAIRFYKEKPEIWRTLQTRGMNGDYSWTHSAGEYLKIYQKLFEDKEPEAEPETETPNPVVVEIPVE